MSKSCHFLIAITVSVSVLVTVVAHTCSNLNPVQAIRQAPCDDGPAREHPRGKGENDNCDSIRYRMLATEASPVAAELSSFYYSTSLQDTIFVILSLPDFQPSFWRSEGPPFPELGATSPQLSHIVLRI